ncbi:hypothetical protein EDB89DRAFT_2084158 [Lactarius sanguifluus]|nr:hypothetical protein EDB89DRAFT_2084158 [Lactarius sanguifluus]
MGTSPPSAISELLFPPLGIDMPVPVPSSRQPPNPIQTQSKSPRSTSSRQDSLPSAVPGAYDTSVIPPSHEARTLVLCFDGMGDQFDADLRAYMPSLSAHFFSMLKKDDKSQQLTYYQAGIGTYTIPEVASPHMAKLKKNIDMAIGSHLDGHVMGARDRLSASSDIPKKEGAKNITLFLSLQNGRPRTAFELSELYSYHQT